MDWRLIKALWITGNFFPLVGGLEIYTDRAVGSLSEVCEVKLLTQHGQGPCTNQRVAHFAVPHLGFPESQAQWQTARRLVGEQIAEFSPDIVHFANAGVAVYRDAVPFGIPTVATVHGNDLTAPWQWVPGEHVPARMIASLSRCDHLFAVSSHTAELVERSGVQGPVTVITAGCDTTYFRPAAEGGEAIRKEFGIADKRPIVLTVGRLVPRKGHKCILEAVRRLPIEVHWIVVGDGPMVDSLSKSIRESGLAHRTTLAGSVSDEKLLQLYNACNLFVLVPEERRHKNYIDSEGFGLVFQEAGACAKPVIGSDISGCRDAVIDGATGLLVPPGDAEALAGAMQKVLEEPGLAKKLGNNAMNFLRASGGWGRFAKQTVEQYREVIANRKMLAEHSYANRSI